MEFPDHVYIHALVMPEFALNEKERSVLRDNQIDVANSAARIFRHLIAAPAKPLTDEAFEVIDGDVAEFCSEARCGCLEPAVGSRLLDAGIDRGRQEQRRDSELQNAFEGPAERIQVDGTKVGPADIRWCLERQRSHMQGRK